MIDSHLFSQYLTRLPIEQKELLQEVRQLQEQYPASSTINFILLKLLQNNAANEYEKTKSQLLLSIIDRRKYHDYKFQTGHISQKIVREEEEVVIDHLIEQFSNDPPKIKFDPEKHDGAVNYGKTSLEEDPDIVSETLAAIYAEQGYVGKAIKMYKKLGLIFPEKSCYFADQIKELKKIKDNNQ